MYGVFIFWDNVWHGFRWYLQVSQTYLLKGKFKDFDIWYQKIPNKMYILDLFIFWETSTWKRVNGGLRWKFSFCIVCLFLIRGFMNYNCLSSLEFWIVHLPVKSEKWKVCTPLAWGYEKWVLPHLSWNVLLQTQ